jgi:protein arginine kinase
VTLDLDLLPDGGVSWLDASGPSPHIVLSTRIRLARNLRGVPFTHRADDAARERLLERVVAAARGAPELAGAAVYRVDQLSRLERQAAGTASATAPPCSPTATWA